MRAMNLERAKNTIAPDILKKAYRDMLLIRRFEEKAAQLYGTGYISGFCHLYIGQEAVAVGVQANLLGGEGHDSVITSYRDHGIMLAIGSEPGPIMAELLGRVGGCSLGKGGSMHMFDINRGFYGGHGIVGAQVPIGTGIAMAYKYRKEARICVVYFGDGAANQGQIYEAFNISKLHNLPVLYIIENNQYGMGTAVNRACAGDGLYKRGEGYGIHGTVVDGMDFFDVYDKANEAVKNVRAGNGPMLLEVQTYRYRGHSMSDPGKYRSKEEVEHYKANDPIVKLLEYMVKNKHVSKLWADEQECKTKRIVADAVDFAMNSPEPGPELLYENVFYKE